MLIWRHVIWVLDSPDNSWVGRRGGLLEVFAHLLLRLPAGFRHKYNDEQGSLIVFILDMLRCSVAKLLYAPGCPSFTHARRSVIFFFALNSTIKFCAENGIQNVVLFHGTSFAWTVFTNNVGSLLLVQEVFTHLI